MIGLPNTIQPETDPDQYQGPWYAQLAVKYGPWAALAAFLVYFVTSGLSSDIKAMKDELRSHVSDNRFFMHQMCVMMAHSSGESDGLCNPPPDEHVR